VKLFGAFDKNCLGIRVTLCMLSEVSRKKFKKLPKLSRVD